jgi:ABC-type dipeptide/oligopeptide/nickel transport system permease component
MVTYIIRRLLYSVLVLIAASFLVFTFVAKGAGDPLGPLRTTINIDQAGLDRIAEEKHLNDSVFVRYGYWARDAVTNNFGDTLLTNKPILPDLWRVMKNTLQLVIVAELLAILIAIGIGVLSALRQYSLFDYTATTFSFLGLAMPLFWLALMLVVLNVQIQGWTGYKIFPVASLNDVDPGSGIDFWIDRAHHLALPIMVLMIASIATYSRFMRASMLEVVNADYVRTARAKGLIERRVTFGHAFRNALVPLVTVIALNFGALIGGAVGADPYPVMAWLMVTATMVIFFNLIADILYGVLDPRVRYD